MLWTGRLSIRQKVQGIIMATCAIALLVAGAVFTVYDRSTFMHEKTQDLATSAQLLGSNSTAAISFGDAGTATEILGALRAKPSVVNACIFQKNGTVFAEYHRAGSHAAFQCPKPDQPGSILREGRMGLLRDITLNGEIIGRIYLEEDLDDLNHRLIGFSEIASLVLLLSLIVAFLLSSRLQRVITGPILKLARTALSVSTSENYSVRAIKSSNDEIGFLFDQFNGMLDRIQQRDVALQQAQQGLERRVAERTSYLNALIENIPLAIVVLNKERRVELCNPAFEKLFQYTRQEAVGELLTKLLGDERLTRESDAMFRLVMDGGEIHQATQRRRKDMTLVDVDLQVVRLYANGEATGCLGIYQDISIRKRSEEALQRAKEAAEAANAAKSQFLANMSHEIRTPMNGIMGMTELVLDTDLDPEQREYLNLAKLSADSLLSLIDDILDYSKIEAGKLELDSTNFDLADSLSDTMKFLSLRAHQKGLELALEIPPDVPTALIGDSGRLRQVIINLLGNAIKFTDQGEIVAHVTTESRTESESVLHFIVADTGIGVPKEKQAEIFDAFRQADGSMTRKYGGTGLGLSISSRLVQLMGGRIWVESEPGKGSRFHFTARFGVQTSSERVVIPRHPSTLRGMRVLVVDDNATNRQILVRTLSNWLMKPVAVDSGADAISTLKAERAAGRAFPLVLLDAQMPEMDGFTLAEYLKQSPDFTTASVMMLSSTGQRGDALRCQQLGVSAYLTKPVSPSDLLNSMLTALGTRPKGIGGSPAVIRQQLSAGKEHLRVLLAEDNAVNQLLALRILEKLGHEVTVVSSGREALVALEKHAIDLVLMDVQMPEMNGLEATAVLREKEQGTGSRVPIIALTAHAMKGDRERCVEAGMDGYVNKPIQLSKLKAEIQRVIDGHGDVPIAADTVTRNGAVDAKELMERIGGDRSLLRELIGFFQTESASQVGTCQSALGTLKAEEVERAGHTLKGMLANLAAPEAMKLAARLEEMGRNRELADADSTLTKLKVELSRVEDSLETLCNGAG